MDEKEYLIKLNRTSTLESTQEAYNVVERLINKYKIIRNGSQNIIVRFQYIHNIFWCGIIKKLFKIKIRLLKATI